MGVYIPNIEMPKSCDDCPHPTCTLWQSVNGGERNEKCPISPVPPHGRLIDADALMGRIEHDTPLSSTFEKIMRRYIEKAPTIIESTIGQLNSDPAVNEKCGFEP